MVYPGAMRVLSETINSSASGNATAKAPAATVVPFGSSEMLDDTLLHVLGFLIVLTAAHPLGLLFPRFMKLPLITGYLIVGILTGPFLANLLTTKTVSMLASSINAMALSFISFQAGQEIYLPELKPQIKGILQLLTVLYFTAMILLTAVMTLGAGPFFYGGFDSMCKLAIALLFGSIAVLGSPATVMAIKIELNSVGPFTNLMLGATMTAEFVVLISFSIARVISSVYCAKLDITIGNLMFTMGIVFSNILVGAFIGLLIIAIFLIPGGPDHHHNHHSGNSHVEEDDDVVVLSSEPVHHPSPPATGMAGVIGSLYFKGFLWLFMGYIFYISTNVISEITISSFGHVWDVKFEPLLVLMVGSCLAGHHSKIRHDMHVILDASAPFVFLPFFVMTGAALKLDQVANAIPLMSLFVSLRYAAIFLACYGAGRWILKLPPQQYNNLWLTMTPQAGVALGLANEIKNLSKDPWASEFAATIVAAVVVNQIVGPVLCAMGLSRAGESGGAQKKVDGNTHNVDNGDDIDLESGQGGHQDQSFAEILQTNESLATIRRAVVIGEDEVACELALQLALHGADVDMPMLSDEETIRWEKLRDHIRSAFLRGENALVNAPIADFRGNKASQMNGGDRGNTSARSRAAITDKPADLIVFTGSEQRVVDHVKLLGSMGPQNKKPRLVAILDSSMLVEQLRNRGVVCIQSSLALSNIGMRVSLMGDTAATQFAATESVPTGEKHWFSGNVPIPATGTSSPELQRVLLHRRRVLQRNIQSTRVLHGLLSPNQAPIVAPQRVSMFGRSSVVDFGIGGGGTTRGGNFFVSNEVYIMGGGQNGDGGYEEGPLDEELYLNSGRSGRGYVAGPSPANTGKRNNAINQFLAKAGGLGNMTGSRGNHRANGR